MTNIPRLSKNAKRKIESILFEVNLLMIVEQPNETCQKVISIVECMPDFEKRIIQERYLDVEAAYTTDQAVYESIGISSPTYSKCRQAAFVKIALGLELVDIFKIDQD
ncbi:hypothetical protein D3C76_1690420 [compost metagenome]